jgi:hypothetical protein
MQFVAAPFFNPAIYTPEQVESYAIIGLAAGTTARQVTAVYGGIPIDGYEIDPEIIRVGREYFAMTEPNLRPIAEDGRVGLAHNGERYTVIGIDAYRPPYIPWHLTTQEFYRQVYAHLDEDGVLVINVGRAPEDRRLIDALAGTIGTVFPSVYIVDIPNTFNSVLYATRQPTTPDDLYRNYQSLVERGDAHPLLLQSLEVAILNLQPNPCAGASPSDACAVFTDDWAPIEWITNSLVLNYIFSSEGLEEIQ